MFDFQVIFGLTKNIGFFSSSIPIRFNDDIKSVEDHIRDDVYIWRDRGKQRIDSPYPHLTPRQIEERDLNSQIMPPDRDPLTMRNSLVNTMFVEARTTPIVDFNLINTSQIIYYPYFVF